MRLGNRPALVGEDLEVPLVTGGRARHVNLDLAASAPALQAVRDSVERFLPWYSSVHRGTGFRSQVSTALYERARGDVARFVNARSDDVVVFTRNTTDSLNLLAAALPDGARVLAFETEHHANLLPWRRLDVRYLPAPRSPSEALDVLAAALPADLVTVTGASNVTGEIWPVAELARIAHGAGARIAVDAAQLAPHAPVDVAGWDVDWLAFSGHKLYAPYGAGALVGRRDLLEAREPFLAGGGAVRFVTVDDVAWSDAPERQEAGSPNVVGAVALAAACRTLDAYGMADLALEEARLGAYARERLRAIDGVHLLELWPGHEDRIGAVTFIVDGFHHGQVAAALSAEYGIAVRDGCFCAHPLMLRLLEVPDDAADRIRAEIAAGDMSKVPGAVRASTGIGTTRADIDALADALEALLRNGPSWTYRCIPSTAEWVPEPDPRPFPEL